MGAIAFPGQANRAHGALLRESGWSIPEPMTACRVRWPAAPKPS